MNNLIELLILLWPPLAVLAIGAAISDYLVLRDLKKQNRKIKHDYK